MWRVSRAGRSGGRSTTSNPWLGVGRGEGVGRGGGRGGEAVAEKEARAASPDGADDGPASLLAQRLRAAAIEAQAVVGPRAVANAASGGRGAQARHRGEARSSCTVQQLY